MHRLVFQNDFKWPAEELADQYRPILKKEQSVGQFWPTRIEVKIDRFATDFLYPLLMIGGLFVVSKPTAANLQVLPKFETYRGKQDNHRT